MINIIEMNSGKIKYWYEELPNMDIPNYLNAEDCVLTKCDRTFSRTKIALEIYLHKNAGYYGLLGVDYIPVPSEKESIKININYTIKNELKFTESILQYDDGVFVGLEEEYVGYMENSIKKHLEEGNKLPSGLLNFAVASNSEIGSSPKLFGIISEMLIDIIATINNMQSIVSMDDIIKDVFYSSRLFVK